MNFIFSNQDNYVNGKKVISLELLSKGVKISQCKPLLDDLITCLVEQLLMSVGEMNIETIGGLLSFLISEEGICR